MTVAKLIEQLQELPPNLEVFSYQHYSGTYTLIDRASVSKDTIPWAGSMSSEEVENSSDIVLIQ